jgi:tetratricopeptide (TPR) repeat protein
MQEILYIKLRQINRHQVELRYSYGEEFQHTPLLRSLNSIDQLVQDTESNYNTAFPGRLDRLGQTLYRWLNGENDRFLARTIQQVRQKMRSQYLVLAIDTDQRLAHLPWELLHDGTTYLVESRKPTILAVRWKEGSQAVSEVANRPLRVLFMATSPRDLSPVLDFEQEEALILTSTQRQKLNLVVEESGNLKELQYLVSEYGESSRFDVFHLNGHATLTQQGPRFYTETETGGAYLANPEEIWEALPYPPHLLFLSGCYTGALGDQGIVTSLAQQLIDQGATAVLGWGRQVRDDQAAQAAAILYDLLAIGYGLAMALSKTYQHLIAEDYENWHLLRLFVSGYIPGSLVTEPRRPGRRDPLFPQHGTTFLNQREKRGEVADYKSFVGRRLILQECIKILKDKEYAGILLWGMGGVGKSSLAHRIIFRLRDSFKPILLTDKFNNILDIQKVRNYIAREIREPELRQALFSAQQERGINRYGTSIDAHVFTYTLRDVLAQTEDRFLFLIDDFEGNFTKQSDGSIDLKDSQTPEISLEALDTLKALTQSILATQEKGHQIIITSRYQIHSSDAENLYQRQLARLEQADVTKKLQRLESNQRHLSVELREQIVKISNGNPRLLEWLFKLSAEPNLQLQSRLDAEQDRFKEDIFIQQILAQLSTEVQQLLGRIAIFELPVTEYIVEQICQDLDLNSHLNQAISLGLLEAIYPLQPNEEIHYSVSQIIAQELPQPDIEIVKQATELAFEKWIASSKDVSLYSPIQEARNQEVYRLAKIVKSPKPLIESARALCKTWYQVGKNYRDIIKCCKEVLTQQPDYQIYAYLASSLFETGERYNFQDKELDGFSVLEKALETCPDDDLKARIELLINYTFWLKDYGNYNKSYQLAQEAERLSTQIDDPGLRIAALNQLAVINCTLGYFDRGEELFRETERLSQGLSPSQSLTLLIVRSDAASSLYWRDLDRRKALKILEANSELFNKSGDVLNYALLNNLVAHIYFDAKAFSKAADLCAQSLELFKRAGSIRGEAYNLILSARIDVALDQAGQAIEKYDKTLKIGEKLGHFGFLTYVHWDLGEFRLGQQEYDQAESHFQNALSYSQQMENLFGIIDVYLSMTRLAIAKQEDISDAIEACRTILSDLQNLDYPLYTITLLNQLGDAHKELQEYDQARQCYQQAMDIRVHANYPGLSHAQYQLGQLYEIQEQWGNALAHYQASLSIYIRNNSPDEQIGTLEAMANVYAKQNCYDEAIDYMDRAIRLRHSVDRTYSALIQSLFNKLGLLDKINRLHSSLSQLEETEKLLDSLDPSYGKAVYLDQIAVYRCRLQYPELALNYWEQTYQILLADYQSTHVVTAFAEQKLAYGLIQINQVERAKERLRAAYAVLRTRLGGQHEIVQAILEAQAAPHVITSVLEKWSLMTLTEIDKQPLPDKSAEVLHMLMGDDIIPIFDPDQGSQIIDRIGKARFSMLAQDYFLFPNIRLMDSTALPKRDYILQLNEKEIFRGKLPTLYAIPSPGGKGPSILNQKITQELGFSFPLLWIGEEAQLPTDTRIYSAEEIVMANLIEILKQKKEQILAAIQ